MKKIIILMAFCLGFIFSGHAQDRYEAIWDTLWSVKSETLKDSPWSVITTTTPVLRGIFQMNSADSINKVLSGGRLIYEGQVLQPMKMPYGLLFYETALFHKTDSLVKTNGQIDAVGHKSFFTNKKDFVANRFLLIGLPLILALSLFFGILMKLRFVKNKEPYGGREIFVFCTMASLVFMIVYVASAPTFKGVYTGDASIGRFLLHTCCVPLMAQILQLPFFLYCLHLRKKYVKNKMNTVH